MMTCADHSLYAAVATLLKRIEKAREENTLVLGQVYSSIGV